MSNDSRTPTTYIGGGGYSIPAPAIAALPFCRALVERPDMVLPEKAKRLVEAFWIACESPDTEMPRWVRRLGLHSCALQLEREAARKRGQVQDLGPVGEDACEVCGGSGYAIISRICGLCSACGGTGWRIR